jgi:hypothetical protein
MQLSDLACFRRSRNWRTLVFLAGVAWALTLGAGRANAAPATTIVNDVVYRADGTPASGKMLISWPAFTTSDGKPVAAGNMSMAIGAGGGVTLALAPNEGATPSGTYYKVVLKLDDGTTETEYWAIPKRTPIKVSEVRSQVVPASVAVQMASRNYVDSTLSGKADDGAVIHKAGDEVVAGVKQFAMSPLVPSPGVNAAVANKAYVDSSIASIGASDFLRKTGDAMLGSLTLAADPTSTNHAANRHYVDLQVAGLASSLGQKLARQNDTPVTMANMRFATQFPSIQDAISDAGTKGSVVIPSDYAGTDGFANPNKVPVFDLRGDASGFRGVYNVKDFGAKPDDNMDDWTAIQAAIDAASAGYGPYGSVYVPKGIYHVSKPLHVTRGIRFFGAGRGETTITGYAAEQGAVMVVSPALSLYPGLPTGPSLATGPGTSMYLNGTYDYFLNLRESGVTELNGRNALTVEFYYKPEAAVEAGNYNLLSSSGSVTGTDANTAFAIHHGEPNQIVAVLNVGGTLHGVPSGVNSIVPGNVYHIAFTYDGSMMRLFINGVLKGSTPASGTIFQKASEDLVLGPRLAGFMESTFDYYMAKGWVDSIRFSSTARYTANFTPPTTKFAKDGNTFFLLNFDNNYDQFTVASSSYGASHLFLRRFGGGWGQVANFHLSDMTLIGSGPEFIYTILSMIDNVEVTAAKRGLQFINNCYLNRLTSVRVVGHDTTQFGLGIGAASGVLTMMDIALTGAHFPFYMDTSSATIHGLWIELAEGTEIGAVLKGTSNGTAVINHPVFSTETNPSTVRHDIASVGMGSVVLTGGVLETANSAPHIGIYGGGSFIHSGGNYSAAGTPPASIFKIVTPTTNPIQLISPIQQWINIPWADNMAAIQAGVVKTNQNCTGNDKVSGISSTGAVVCAANPSMGYTLTLSNLAANVPANGATYYIGGDVFDYNNGNFDAAKIEVPKAGTIKRIQIRQNVPSGNIGSAENVTHKLCINSGTACFGSVSFAYNGVSTSGNDVTLNQPVVAGDTIAIRVDTPTWTTRPLNVRWYAVVYIE